MIWQYIAEDSIDAADHWLEQIYASISTLVEFPHRGHWRTDLAPKHTRFDSLGSYLIAYLPGEKPLLVLAVLYGGRQVSSIAALLRQRDTRH